MSAQEALQAFSDELAKDAAHKIAPYLIQLIEKFREDEPDPLLTAKETAKELDLSESTARTLMQGGYIARAPGLTELRARRSVVRAYGTANGKKGAGK